VLNELVNGQCDGILIGMPYSYTSLVNVIAI